MGFITFVFRFLDLLVSFVVALAHGSNDVANAITPLLITQDSYSKYKTGEANRNKSGYWLGSVGIATGLILFGKPVIETVGKKIVKINFVVGFCSSLATGVAVIFGSYMGLPLSTTHCMVGSLLGIVVARKVPFCKYAYMADDQHAEMDQYLEEQREREKALEAQAKAIREAKKAEEKARHAAELGEGPAVEATPATVQQNAGEGEEAGAIDNENKVMPMGDEASINHAPESPDRYPPWISGKAPKEATVHGPVAKENFGLNVALFVKIFIMWIITVPVAFCTAYIIEVLMQRFRGLPPSITLNIDDSLLNLLL
jgi:phosphate/sulfate permease